MATKKKKMNAKTKAILNTASISVLAMLSLMLILRNCDRCKSKCNDAATKVILLDSANYMLPGTVSIVNNNNPVIEISSDVKVDNKVNNSAKAVNTTRPVKKSKPSVKPVVKQKKKQKPIAPKTQKDTTIVNESKKIEKDTLINGCPAHVVEETKAKEVISDGERRAYLEWKEVVKVRVKAVPCKTR